MRKFGMAAVGALASVAMAGTAIAATPAARERVIEVPPGSVVLVLPAPMSMQVPQVQTMLPPIPAARTMDIGFPFPPVPSPGAIIREVNALMASTEHMFDRAFAPLPAAGPGVSGVFITSFSDGHGTCTQRVTYTGDNSRPVMKISSTGDACARAGVHVPTTAPVLRPRERTTPHLIEASAHRHAGLTELAQLAR